MDKSFRLPAIFLSIFLVLIFALTFIFPGTKDYQRDIEDYLANRSKHNGRVISVCTAPTTLVYFGSDRVAIRARVAFFNAFGNEVRDNRVFVYGNEYNERDKGKITTMMTEGEAILAGADLTIGDLNY